MHAVAAVVTVVVAVVVAVVTKGRSVLLYSVQSK